MHLLKRQSAAAMFILATGLAMPSGAGAQAPEEQRAWISSGITIYRERNFSGPAVAIEKPRPDLHLAWPIGSVRVRSGTWQLCEQPNYRGNCRTVSSDSPALSPGSRGLAVQSARPANGGGGSGGNLGPNLRGSFAQFFTQPMQGNGRVPACSGGAASPSCASRTADSFCRSAGWNGSAREHMETVGRTVFLADVLCVRSGY